MPRMLMLVGIIPAVKPNEDGFAVAIRFFDPKEGPKRVLQLAKNQVRKRYPTMTKEERKAICWEVYEPKLKNGGWPEGLGSVHWYM